METTINEIRYPETMGVETDEQVETLGMTMHSILSLQGIDYLVRVPHAGECERFAATEYTELVERAWSEALDITLFE